MIKHTHVPNPGRKNSCRVIINVLDGAGVGALPDAGRYGDEGANTLLNVISRHGPLKLPNLLGLGLGQVLRLSLPSGSGSLMENDRGATFGRMAALSPGKDTTSGHWELAGLVLESPFPVYPNGFPEAVIERFERAVGRKVLGNIVASGTAIIDELGEKHRQTGKPIVYTSADSVFQIAAHEAVVPPGQLYDWCRAAREILQGEHAVGRVIARPFTGSAGQYTRTAGRRDFSLSPPGPTILDIISEAGLTAAVIGKVADVFNHRGVSLHRPGSDNEAVAASLLWMMENVFDGLIWATFGDFDTLYGHRNDSEGFARALESYDLFLGAIKAKLGPRDLLFITADHGCDPTHPGTDHTREYVPLMAWSPAFNNGGCLGTRNTMADLAATAAAWLSLEGLQYGEQFSERFNCRP